MSVVDHEPPATWFLGDVLLVHWAFEGVMSVVSRQSWKAIWTVRTSRSRPSPASRRRSASPARFVCCDVSEARNCGGAYRDPSDTAWSIVGDPTLAGQPLLHSRAGVVADCTPHRGGYRGRRSGQPRRRADQHASSPAGLAPDAEPRADRYIMDRMQNRVVRGPREWLWPL